MAADFQSPVQQTKAKWLQKCLDRETKKKYLKCSKAPVVAKCPKCSTLHETFIQWTGRGMPRIFCGNCRYLISTVNDVNDVGNASELTRTARRMVPGNVD